MEEAREQRTSKQGSLSPQKKQICGQENNNSLKNKKKREIRTSPKTKQFLILFVQSFCFPFSFKKLPINQRRHIQLNWQQFQLNTSFFFPPSFPSLSFFSFFFFFWCFSGINNYISPKTVSSLFFSFFSFLFFRYLPFCVFFFSIFKHVILFFKKSKKNQNNKEHVVVVIVWVSKQTQVKKKKKLSPWDYEMQKRGVEKSCQSKMATTKQKSVSHISPSKRWETKLPICKKKPKHSLELFFIFIKKKKAS